MKKFLFKIIGIIATGIFILFLLFAGFSVWVMRDFQGPDDTFAILGDGKFELGKFSAHLALEDHRFNDDQLRIMVSDIEKYILKGDTIYSVGDYIEGAGEFGEGEYLDLKTGEYISYKKGDIVPRYLILNTRTAELRKYVTWEEIPEEDQKIFEQAKPYVFDSWELNKL